MARKQARYEAPESDDQALYDAAMGEAPAAPLEGEYIDDGSNAALPAVIPQDGEIDGIDRSGCLDEDDGWNWAREKFSPDLLLSFDTTELVGQLHFLEAKKKEITAIFEARKKLLAAQLADIEKAIMAQLKRAKMIEQSFTFDDVNGVPVSLTVKRADEVGYAVADWNALYDWVLANGACDVLQQRVSVTRMKHYMDLLSDMAGTGEITAEEAVIPGVSKTTWPVLKVSSRTKKSAKAPKPA